jgi:hypothetical protein
MILATDITVLILLVVATSITATFMTFMAATTRTTVGPITRTLNMDVTLAAGTLGKSC